MPENSLAFSVFNRCGDDGAMDAMGGSSPVPAPSIEAIMNIMAITEPQDRLIIFDEVKLISRTIIQEQVKERRDR